MKLFRFSSCFIACFFMYSATLVGMPGMPSTQTPSAPTPSTPATGMPGMPGIVPPAPTKTVDQKIADDLNSLKKYYAISDKRDLLKKILNYASNQPTSQQSQINFCNALNDLDKTARTYGLSQIQINLLLKLFKQAQSSTLIYAGFIQNISDIIQYWENSLQSFGLSRYQQAIQRRREAPRNRREE